jgi:hypothetical protein
MRRAKLIAMQFRGQLIGLFSFDVGYEIDLDRARQLTAQTETRALERRRAAPAHIDYTTPPLRVPLGRRDVKIADRIVTAEAHGLLHEFGALTISLQLDLATQIEALPALTAALAATGTLEGVARSLLDGLYKVLLPAIAKPGLNPLIEDFYVLQCDSIAPLSIDDFLTQMRGPLASTLRCEAESLSESEITDVLRSRLSYYPDDLILTEWNVAFIVDNDYKDAINVLEHLNVQLLELRHYDAVLDRHVAESYDVSAKPARIVPFLHRRYNTTIQELSAIRIDVTTIVERIHNALKLSGDLYLAKVYARTAERLGLPTWERNVADKLDVLQDMYNVLVQRVATARAEALELTIIILITVEIALFLAGWGT